MIINVIKRNCEIVKFDFNKITLAIQKAAKSVGEEINKNKMHMINTFINNEIQEFLGSFGLCNNSENKIGIEDIQNIVEKNLTRYASFNIAKAYIIYREKRRINRENLNTTILVAESVDEYLSQTDWRTKENANSGYSVGGLQYSISSKVIANYWLKKIYPKEVSEAHINGDIHIHDLGFLGPYCQGHSLRQIIAEGFGGVEGETTSGPAKHLYTLVNQIINFIYTLQNEFAGAQAFSSVDTLFAPFVYYDGLNYKQTKQCIQSLVYGLNIPSRSCHQKPFVNFTFDTVCPEDLKEQVVILGGVHDHNNKTYNDFQKEMDWVNKAFIEIMTEGDIHGRGFSFPIPTYNITKYFNWDSEIANMIFTMTGKYGTPTFQNFINSDINTSDVRSMCCRLLIDKTKLTRRGGGLFGSNDQVGCYDEKTEILTDNGWIYFKDLTMNDNVCTIDKNNNIVYNKPKTIFKYNYNGEMVEFKNRNFDLLVTPNHNMYTLGYKNKKEIIRADKKKFELKIPKKGNWIGERKEKFVLPSISNNWISGNHNSKNCYIKENLFIDMDTWLKFLGLFISEGSFDNDKIAKKHGYRVMISKKKHCNIVEDVLNKLPFFYKKYGINYTICNKQLWSYLKQFGKQQNRFIPKDIKLLSKQQLEILYKYLIIGDGTTRKNISKHGNYASVYYTISKKLSDDVQEIILKIGYHPSVSIRQERCVQITNKKYKSKPCYQVICCDSNTYNIKNKFVNKVNYNGFVYCCEVENHVVLVRRNNCITWCGNSLGVCTINLPRLSYLSDKNDLINSFYSRLDYILNVCKTSLEIKRKTINKLTEDGLYPYSKRYIQSWENHFSTIGVIGMHEACLNLFGKGIDNSECKKFAEDVLYFCNNRLIEYQNKTGNLYNLEASPAEGASYRLAKIDKKEFVSCKHSGDDNTPYYTNSTMLPVGYTDDIFEALDHQESLQKLYSGGTIFHMFLGEKISGDVCKYLLKTACENYRIPFYSITPTYSICETHGYLSGSVEFCPQCNCVTQIYSRVVGYYQPLARWNIGKKSEFRDRKVYKIE